MRLCTEVTRNGKTKRKLGAKGERYSQKKKGKVKEGGLKRPGEKGYAYLKKELGSSEASGHIGTESWGEKEGVEMVCGA